MRTLLLMVAAVVVAAAGFAAYVWWQAPDRGVIGQGPAPLVPTPLKTTPTGVGKIGIGEGIAIRTFTKEGDVSSIFRANQYVPRETRGIADVIEPEYEFFLKNGKRLILSGDKGTVNIEERKGRNESLNAGAAGAAPTSGQLFGVSIRIFDPGAQRPAMTLETNNVSFDNQTFKIATEAYTDASGNSVAADEVPVTIRGADVDFDGRGLIVRYDDLNQRVALLQIAHGERVVVKNPGLIAGSKRNGHRKPATQPVDAPAALAQKPPAPATAPATQPAAVTAYRASFRDHVRITQGGRPMAEADIVSIDFRPQEARPAPPATQAATRPSTGPATASTQIATTAPATRPAEPPIVIKWTGPLRLTALEKETVVPLAPGESAITASGSPLMLYQPQGTVVAASMLMRTADESVTFYNGESSPNVIFSDAKGDTRLTSTQVDYSDRTRTAVLLGSSSLRMKQPATTQPSTRPAQDLLANWTDRCEVKLDDAGAARQIDIRGHVQIQHPQMKLKSDALSLAFKPDAKDKTKSHLEQATATGNVDADLSDVRNANRRVKSDKLVVTMGTKPDGGTYPALVDAYGSVNATDADQSLVADHVQLAMKPKATTRPATRPADAGEMASVDVMGFLAAGKVSFKSRDGSGKGDEIVVSMQNDHPVVELRGNPATLTQQDRTIMGDSILARPDDGYALVDGAGSIKQAGSPTTRPVDLTWAGRAEMQAAKNVITFRDKIVVKTTDTDGTIVNATADEMIVTLKSIPSGKPSTRPLAATRPTQVKVAGEATRNKALASVTLAGNVKVTSDKLDAAGQPLKHTTLEAGRVLAGFDDRQQFATLDIPGAGWAYHWDVPETKPKEPQQGAEAIRIEWKKSFHLDQNPEPLATISGDVKVNQVPAGGDAEKDMMTLQSSRVRIAMKPAPTTRPATRPGTTTRASTRPSFAVGIRHVAADAPVRFSARNIVLIAQTLQFDPADHQLVVTGTNRAPVTWYDAGGRSQGEFGELWFDTDSQTVLKWTDVRMRGRQ